MTLPLFATKLNPPALHPKRVHRARLVESLNQGLDAGHGLTLISAPAGFGKTICAGEWLLTLGRPAAWLSLEPGDDEPLGFFRYFLAALQRLDGRVGRELGGALRAGELPDEPTLTAALVEDLLLLEQLVVLVCDDFHHIQNSYILGVIERLVYQRLPGLHLVLVTREDPLLPLARLRANVQLTEIRAADLRFNPGEAAGLLRGTLGLPLSDADAAALELRTEGWAAGLQLAGLSLRGRSDPAALIAALNGSHRYILSYLTEEVLARQSADTRAFLQQTAILERLTGSLCDAVTGGSASGEVLERLYNANLFLTPLDEGAGNGVWFRYHNLFADLLRSHTSRLPQANQQVLHRRAAHWYAQAGLPSEAIRHALAAGDDDLVLAQVEQHAGRTLTGGDVLVVENWLQAVPPERLAASAPANLANGWLHLIRGRYAQAFSSAGQAEALLEPTPPARDLRANLLALQANLANVQGRAADGIRLGQAALEQAGPQAHFARGQALLALGGAYRLQGNYPAMLPAYQQAIVHSQLAGNVLGEVIATAGLVLAAYQRGELHFAQRTAAPLIERFERVAAGERAESPPPITGTVYGALGMIEYQWNHLEAARIYFQQSLRLAALGGHNAGIVYSRLLLARLAQAEGSLAAAVAATQEAAAGMSLGIPAWLRPEVIEQQVRLYLATGQPELAETALAAGGPVEAANDLLALAVLRLAVHRAERDPGQQQLALDQATGLISRASSARRAGIVLQALLLRARLHRRMGSPAALDDLAQALELGEPEGCLRAFIEEGQPMVNLLRSYLPRCAGSRADYVREILAAAGEVWPDDAAMQPTQPPKSSGQPLEKLSERELEVLRLMAEGLKYEEMAERLVVSLNTVRYHVKAIYGKLGANNRTRALEAARDQNYLG